MLDQSIEYGINMSKLIDDVNRGQGGMNEDPLAMILDYIRMVFHVDLIKFNWMLKEVKLHLKDAELFIEQIGMLESMIAIANFREMMPYVCLPELQPVSGTIKMY